MRTSTIANAFLLLACVPTLSCGGACSRDTATEVTRQEPDEEGHARCCVEYPGEAYVAIMPDANATRHVGPGCDAADIPFTRADHPLPLRFRTLDNRCTRPHVEAAEASWMVPAGVNASTIHRVGIRFTSNEAVNDYHPFDGCRPLEPEWVEWRRAIDFLTPALHPEEGVAPDRISFCPGAERGHRFVLYWTAARLVVALDVPQLHPYFTALPDDQNAWLWDLGADADRPCGTTPPAGATRDCVPEDR